MTGPAKPNAIAEQIATTIAEAAAATLSQITSNAWKYEAIEAEAAADAISVRFQSAEGLQGEFSFELGKRAAVELARLFVGEAPPPPEITEPTEDEGEALDELLRTIAGAAATALRAHFGRVELKFIGREAAPWTPADRRSLALAQAETRIAIILAFSEEILTPKAEEVSAPEQIAPSANAGPGLPRPHLSAEKRGAEGGAPKAANSPASSGPEPSLAATGTAAVPVNRHDGNQSNAKLRELMRDGNLDLLFDVELGVTLRFGSREMLMKDILELSSGSVIELDRQVSEPVDLLVDRRVIAKGEVVIVDGNYGLRITEVASREQKIECLR